MNTCGTCRHWGTGPKTGARGDKGPDTTSVYRTCGAIIQDDPDSTSQQATSSYWDDLAALDEIDCGEPKEPNEEVAAFRKAHRAAVVDGSGYFAALKVREDFGCIDWKDDEPFIFIDGEDELK